MECNYINGKKNGFLNNYHKNGNINTETYIQKDKITHFYNRYKKNGNLIEEYIFKIKDEI